jgi:hypothetical protein
VGPPLSVLSSSFRQDELHGRAIPSNRTPYPPCEISGLNSSTPTTGFPHLGYLMRSQALPRPSRGARSHHAWRPTCAPPLGGNSYPALVTIVPGTLRSRSISPHKKGVGPPLMNQEGDQGAQREAGDGRHRRLTAGGRPGSSDVS